MPGAGVEPALRIRLANPSATTILTTIQRGRQRCGGSNNCEGRTSFDHTVESSERIPTSRENTLTANVASSQACVPLMTFHPESVRRYRETSPAILEVVGRPGLIAHAEQRHAAIQPTPAYGMSVLPPQCHRRFPPGPHVQRPRHWSEGAPAVPRGARVVARGAVASCE